MSLREEIILGKKLVRLLIGLSLTLAMPSIVAAGQDDDRALVDRFLREVTTLAGRFEQSLIDAEGVVVEVSRGDMVIQRPGRFKWVYAEPYEQWLVADGLNIWSYDVDLAQVTVRPQSEALSNTPALLLGGSGDVLDQFLFDGSRKQEATTWVHMRPVDDTSGFDRVELGFVSDDLQRMAFFDNLGQTTYVELSGLRVNEPVDGASFEFVVPEDADLVGVPLAAEDALP